MNEMDNLKWYVFYLRSRHEKKVITELEKQNILSYLPLRKVLKQYSDRKKWVEEPVFKSYVFIKTFHDNLYNLVQIPGIVTWVRYAGLPATIREDHLDLIRKLIQNNTEFEIQETRYKVGDEITLTQGPFIGHKGHILQIRGKNRFLIVLDNLNLTLVVGE